MVRRAELGRTGRKVVMMTQLSEVAVCNVKSRGYTVWDEIKHKG